MTRGRHTNQAFVAAEDHAAALDILTQALTQDWIDQPATTRQSPHPDKTLDPSPRAGEPGHHVAIDNPTSNDDPEWQRINRSIDAARQRRAPEHTTFRQHRGIGR